MNYPASIIDMYQLMMKKQKLGVFTEHSLLDFLPWFWYNGDYNEYYTDYYISRKSRGKK